MKMTDELGVNLEIEQAKRELAERRKEYAKLLAEYDELTGAVRRHLEAEYMMQIGRLEYRLFSLQIRARQLKREIALYQAAKNRNETISETEVAAIIEREFAEYKAQLAACQEKIREAETLHFSPKLTVGDTKAIRELYHDMVRKLHPDLNRDLPTAAKDLWVRIAAAYKNGDWRELNILADMVYDLLDRGSPAAVEWSCMDELQAERRRIEQKIAELRAHMKEVCSHPPYTYRALLEDQAAVMAKRRELRELRRGFEEHIAELTAVRDGLRGEKND